MASIVIFGGTGYAGSAIAAEAVRRGHSVTAVSRSGGAPSEDVTGREGSIHNAELVDELAGDADVIVVAVRADGAGLRDAIGLLTGAAARHGARLGVVGGAGVRDELRASPEEVDWFYVSPGAMFGAYAPGTATGQYRTGGDVLIVDADGNSEISGPDYA